MKKLRPLGDILLDMEPLIQEIMDTHNLQNPDFIGLMDYYLRVHYPEMEPVYEDNTSPVIHFKPNKKGKNNVRR